MNRLRRKMFALRLYAIPKARVNSCTLKREQHRWSCSARSLLSSSDTMKDSENRFANVARCQVLTAVA